MSGKTKKNDKPSINTTEDKAPPKEDAPENVIDPRDPTEMTIQATLDALESDEGENPEADPEPTDDDSDEPQDKKEAPPKEENSDQGGPEATPSQPAGGEEEGKLDTKDAVSEFDDELSELAQKKLDAADSKNEFTKEELDFLQTLITDPAQVKNDIKRELRDEMRAEAEHVKQVEQRWDTFYQKNPELKKHKELVALCKSQIAAEYKGKEDQFKWDDALEKLAKKSKALIASIRSDQYEEVDTDASSEIAGVSSSGFPTPTQVKKPVSKSFIEQARSHKVR